MKLSPQVQSEFEQHVLKEYPNEAVGVQIAGQYIPCKNTHENPQKAFKIAPKEMLKLEEIGQIEAIFHSHPYDTLKPELMEYNPHWPSKVDLTRWRAGNTPWVITSTDGGGIGRILVMDKNDPAPLLGREFIWGYQDCYCLVVDYYKERLGIDLMPHTSDWNWWNNDGNVIMDVANDMGFFRVDPLKAQIHDLCFFKNQSRVINHLGIISGANEIMQQGAGSLSRVSRYDLYKKDVVMYVRHKNLL